MGTQTKRLQYRYDVRGNRSALIDHDGGRFTYTYDAVNRITQVQNPQGDRTSYSYDDASRRTLKRLANGTRASFAYDPAGNLTKLYNLKSDGSVISSFDYQYDKVGNRTAVVEADGSRVTWSYDATYQLTGEHRTGTSAYRDTYTYDPTGNRTLKNHDGARTTSTYDAANQLIYSQDASGRTTYTFDADGNQQVVRAPNGDRTTYVWDYENRMTRVQLPSGVRNTMAYEPEGLRVKLEESTGVKKFVWDEQNYLAETDASNDTQVVYTNEPRRYGNLVSQRRLSGGVWTPHWYHFDAIGSTRELTTSGQVVSDTRLYDAWGVIQAAGGTTDFPWHFVGAVGYYHSIQTLLHYVRARLLCTRLGRWLSVDAVRAAEGQYTYCKQSPLSQNDPSGLQGAPVPEPVPLELFYTYSLDICKCEIHDPCAVHTKWCALITCARTHGCLKGGIVCADNCQVKPPVFASYDPDTGRIKYCANTIAAGIKNQPEQFQIYLEEVYHALTLCPGTGVPGFNDTWLKDLMAIAEKHGADDKQKKCIRFMAEEIIAKYCAGVSTDVDGLKRRAKESLLAQTACKAAGASWLPHSNPIDNTINEWFKRVDDYCSALDAICINTML